jgi:imidazoleglycerol-phosphate dehydratase
MRRAEVRRETRETRIAVKLNVDGRGLYEIATGLGFFDHMLSHIAAHGLFDLTVQAEGDLEVDAHHTVEDVALALGAAFDQALGERKGLVRMGSAFVPMDETLAFVAVDLSGRPYAVVDVAWTGETVGGHRNGGGIPVTLWAHFLESLAVTARANIHARVLYGRDDHHKAEALFKALGRAMDAATQIEPRRRDAVPSTKGIL